MATSLETKACAACATAKRRCGKQRPHCQRCTSRALECRYPPSKPTRFVLSGGDDTIPIEHNPLSANSLQSFTFSPGRSTSQVDASMLSLGLRLPVALDELVDSRSCSNWFTSPETWEIDRFLQVGFDSETIVGLKRLNSRVHRWLTQWIETGSNPFIHARLYRTRFPSCIQNAYTTLTCYLHKTAFNEQTILNIVEARAKQLVAEHSIPAANPLLENIDSPPTPLDSFEHVARVQALLVYQFLCLYDGDIRLRQVAESHMPVLDSWTQQMVDHASHTVCLGGSVISLAHGEAAVASSLSGTAPCETLLWYSWILAESIRRTWLVASGIQGTYLVLQQHRPIPCQGGMMITTRRGVWEAPSALTWVKLCSRVNVGLMQVAETDKLFIDVAPEEVDEFTMLILHATFGEERMERWGI